MTTPTILSVAEVEAQVIMASLALPTASRRALLVEALVEHSPNVAGLDPYADLLLEALVAERAKLKEVRSVLDQGHAAAYDLRNDVLAVLDREESQ